MKKIIALGIFITTTKILFSQPQEIPGPVAKPEKTNTFELQAKGSVNLTFLLNKNISDTGPEQDYAAGMGFNYGLAFNAYFGNVGFGIEGLMGNHKGAYAGTVIYKNSTGLLDSITYDYKSSVNLKTISIPVLFKLKSKDGTYFEVGPQYNLISSANYKRTGTGFEADTSVTTNFASSYFSGVIGFGFKIKFGDESPLSMNAGLRLQYTFTDIEGVDGLGVALNNPFKYPTKESTSGASAGLMIALTYKLGGK